MLNSFLKYYQETLQLQQDQKILLAVSGGIDSMVMLYLFRAANIPVGVAHVNFQLRGKDADEDALFVKDCCEKSNTPFFTTAFDTKKIATERKQSIQVVARDTRYDWLMEIKAKHDYDFIATAHHLNDSIETAIYNFAKGTGIKGLTGIPSKRGDIIRPLLFATKNEIEKYAASFEIQYREDASNASDKYSRNFIRHSVIPTLQSINPSLEKTAAQNFKQLNEITALYLERIEQIKNEVITSIDNSSDNHSFEINRTAILKYSTCQTILFEILSPYGFNNDQISQMLKSTDTNSGRQFFSNTHRVTLNRDHLILDTNNKTNSEAEISVPSDAEIIKLSDHIIYASILTEIPETFESNLTHLDLDKLKFPLKFRRWKPGDVFQPMGMDGKQQKLKDYFTNQKLSIPEKEKVWILESNNEICWIAGYRIDERYKVTEETKRCWVLEVGALGS